MIAGGIHRDSDTDALDTTRAEESTVLPYCLFALDDG